MSQASAVGELGISVGYTLKQAATALRATMDAALRPHGLTVPQYSCLEVLGQRPGLSGSELARAVFVSRQTMNQVVRGLQDRGLLTRPEEAATGRARPTALTPAGREVLQVAGDAIAAVEARMVAGMTSERRSRLLTDLRYCIDELAREPVVDRGGADPHPDLT